MTSLRSQGRTIAESQSALRQWKSRANKLESRKLQLESEVESQKRQMEAKDHEINDLKSQKRELEADFHGEINAKVQEIDDLKSQKRKLEADFHGQKRQLEAKDDIIELRNAGQVALKEAEERTAALEAELRAEKEQSTKDQKRLSDERDYYNACYTGPREAYSLVVKKADDLGLDDPVADVTPEEEWSPSQIRSSSVGSAEKAVAKMEDYRQRAITVVAQKDEIHDATMEKAKEVIKKRNDDIALLSATLEEAGERYVKDRQTLEGWLRICGVSLYKHNRY
jgi:hypothetical protein